jgi:hypothetical protein
MQRLLLATAAGLFAFPLSAQQFFETFPFPDGPVPPTSGWTARSGSWAIRNGRAVQTLAAWGYLTRDNVQALNCVVDADCFWTANGLQFGGTAARHAGTSANDAVMVKIQSNSATPSGFDTAWNYEQPGSAVARTGITPPLTAVRVRLQLLGNSNMMWVDQDRNGTWDWSVGPKVLTAHTAPGMIGINGYSNPAVTEVDNVAFFDAVYVAAASSTPRIGTIYRMEMHTTSPMRPFIAALSLTPGRTPLPDGRGLPLGLDPLVTLTLSLGSSIGLAGVTDAQGLAALRFPLPNDPSLIGVRVIAAGFTIDPARPLGIGDISNDHQFVIQ